MRKIFPILLLTFLISSDSFSYDFNEHRDIGNRGFNLALNMAVKHGYFKDSAQLISFLKKDLKMSFDLSDSTWAFDELSHTTNLVSYGVICGLSGDHEQDPLTLKEKLMYKESVLNKILYLQNLAGYDYATGATDEDLLHADFRYGLFAVIDMSHFYDYGLSLTDHIDEFEKRRILLLKKPRNVDRIFRELQDVNSIVKYMTIHSMAVHLAEMAGSTILKGDTAKSASYLFYAFLFNAFADHFLEDMFSAGHMIVNRSLLGGVINNKALHDFYNKLGLKVMNLKSEIWTTHGDRSLNIPEEKWLTLNDYAKIKNTKVTEKFQKAINAVGESVFEIWAAYNESKKDGKVDFMSTVPGDDTDKRLKERFFLERFKAFNMIPVPFGSDLYRYDLELKKLPRLRKVNKLLAQRNFVRNRVANSLIFIFRLNKNKLGFERLPAETHYYFGGRFNLSSSYYIYDDNPDKGGTMDHWFGITMSVLAGLRQGDASDIWQYKAGGVYTGDFWVSKTRYMSPFVYLEAGIDRRSKDYRMVIAPSVGLQLGPLLGLDNFTIPDWIRIPLSIILPLKPVFSYEIIAGLKPELKVFGEIDLVF